MAIRTARFRLVASEEEPPEDDLFTDIPDSAKTLNPATSDLVRQHYWGKGKVVAGKLRDGSEQEAQLVMLIGSKPVTFVNLQLDGSAIIKGNLRVDGLIVDAYGNPIVGGDSGAQGVTEAEMIAAIDGAINGLINGAPGALNQLSELAAAMGNDANFAATMANVLATKLTQAQADLLYKAIGWQPSWGDISGKPSFGDAATKNTGVSGGVALYDDPRFGQGGGGGSNVLTSIIAADINTTQNTAQDTGLQFNAAANTKYIVDGVAFINNNSAGVKFAFDIPAAATMRISSFGTSSGATSWTSSYITADATLTGEAYSANSSATRSFVQFKGQIWNGANAGLVKLQYASTTSGNTSNFFKESFLTARPVA